MDPDQTAAKGAVSFQARFFHGGKQYGPRSDCCQGSSLIWVHIFGNTDYIRT